MAAVKALQQWCRVQCEGYRDVSITNMTTSFRDGLAFCALIHKHRPDLINFDSLKKDNVYDNNKLAFKVAEQELGIPALLDAEDMVALKVPDRLSILTYVSQYYNYFHGRSPIGGMGGIKRPADGPTDQPSGKKNQPVTSKVFPSSKPARENSPPPSKFTRPPPSPKPPRNSTQDVLVEKSHQTGTLSNKCVSCNKHVHLVQRHLVDGKLYHRNCAKSLSPISTIAPFRDLPTNTHISKFTPLPDSSKTNAATSTNTPSRLGPTCVTEKPTSPPRITSTPPKVTNPTPTVTSVLPTVTTTSHKVTSVLPTVTTTSHKVTSVLPTVTTTPPRVTSTFSSPSWPASGLSSTAKESTTVSKAAPSRDTTVTTTTSVTTRPTAAPRTSATAAKTLQSKLKFFQSDHTAGNEEKKTSSVNIDIDKGQNVSSKTQEATAGQAVTVVVNMGSVGKKDPNESLSKAGNKAKVSGTGVKVSVKQEEEESKKTKAEAAAFISKKLAEENNNNNSKPSWMNVALKKTDKPQSVVETPKKATEGVRGRVKLRADPSLLADLHPPNPPKRAWSPGGKSTLTAGTPEKGGSKPRSASPNTSVSENESPADWRSMLKPVSNETKPAGPPQSSPKPWRNGAAKTSEISAGPSSSSSHLPSLSISVTPPASKGFQNGQKEKTANGTKPDSKTSKTKPDYIPKEDIMKELQEIEDNLNELEKRGVELEMKLRSSEEEGVDDSVMDELMVEWFNLIRNKQVAMRRESELVYIGRTQDLEEQQPSVEQELRRLMEKPEHLKTAWDRKREEQLMAKLMEIVNDRNAIVEGLDEDRLREEEEDEQLNKMMMNFNFKKDKPKKKSPMSKLFGWGNKKEG